MRPLPAANLGNRRRPFECRVKFHALLANAALGPPQSHTLATAPTQSSPTPPTAAPTPPAMTEVELDLSEFWESEYGRQLDADRERIEHLFTRVVGAVGELRESQAARLAEWQRAAVELAMTIATRLLHERVMAGEFPMEAKV